MDKEVVIALKLTENEWRNLVKGLGHAVGEATSLAKENLYMDLIEKIKSQIKNQAESIIN